MNKNTQSLCYHQHKNNYFYLYLRAWCALKRKHIDSADQLILEFLKLRIEDFLLSRKKVINKELVLSIYRDFTQSKMNKEILFLLKQSLSNLGVSVDYAFSSNRSLARVLKNPYQRINLSHHFSKEILDERGVDYFFKILSERFIWKKKMNLAIWRTVHDNANKFSEEQLSFLEKNFEESLINSVQLLYMENNKFKERIQLKKPEKWNFNQKRKYLKRIKKFPRLKEWAEWRINLIENGPSL